MFNNHINNTQHIQLEVVNSETKKDLTDHLKRSKNVKYVLFCAHHKPKNGIIDKNCLSQWYESSFQLNGDLYYAAEHYMMAQKTKLFGANDVFKSIVNSKSPKDAKQLGREI